MKQLQSNKQIIVDAIIHELKNGKERGNFMARVCKKWQISVRTFDRYLKIAQEQHCAMHQAIEKELAEVDKQAAIDGRKRAIMTINERKLVLTQIATGNLKLKKWWIGKDYEIAKVVSPDYSDRRAAIAELNKMDGAYAPEKIALNTNGRKKFAFIPRNGSDTA